MKSATASEPENNIAATFATAELIEKMVAGIFSDGKIEVRLKPQDSFYDPSAAIEIGEAVQVAFYPDVTGMIKDNSEIRAGGTVLIDDERRIDFTFFLSVQWQANEQIDGNIPDRSAMLSKSSIIDLISGKEELTNAVFTLDLIAYNTNSIPVTLGQGRGFLMFFLMFDRGRY